jgi:hypothetical protein
VCQEKNFTRYREELVGGTHPLKREELVGGTHPLKREELVGGTHPRKKNKDSRIK